MLIHLFQVCVALSDVIHGVVSRSETVPADKPALGDMTKPLELLRHRAFVGRIQMRRVSIAGRVFYVVVRRLVSVQLLPEDMLANKHLWLDKDAMLGFFVVATGAVEHSLVKFL